ncbi:MAG: hypothetical protein ACOX6L_11485 [Syntrophomonadaceae bacterium]
MTGFIQDKVIRETLSWLCISKTRLVKAISEDFAFNYMQQEDVNALFE